MNDWEREREKEREREREKLSAKRTEIEKITEKTKETINLR